MRRLFILIPAALLLVSCMKDVSPDTGNGVRSDVIAFSAVPGNTYIGTMTKAEALTSVSSIGTLYVSATTGPAGNEHPSWVSEEFTMSGSKFSSERVWPAEDPEYHFYASNLVSSFDENGMTVSVDCTKDAVVGYLATPTYHEDNTITLDHILTRLGDVVVTTDGSGYTLSNVSVTFLPINEGTYNIRTRQWTSLMSTCSPVQVANAAGGTKSNDIYFIPGDYMLGVQWTVTDAEGTRNYSNGFPVTFEPGKQSRLELVLKGKEAGHLSLVALEEGTFTMTIPASVGTGKVSYVSYSVDEGATWVKTDNSGSDVVITTPTIEAGRRVLWKGSGTAFKGVTFSSTGTFNVEGNIMSLLYDDGFEGVTSLSGTSIFSSLFAGSKVINASGLILPATTLCSFCYSLMFNDCQQLEYPPVLPAMNLGSHCYDSMFKGCISLLAAPVLPATNLAESCYASMFYGCTSLRNAPVLASTSLFNSCYAKMFYGCTLLVDAPELPATTMKPSCYNSMFYGCTSLVEAPVLRATTLVGDCYYRMFYNCSSLVYVEAYAENDIGSSYTYYWMTGVHSGGVFVKKAGTIWYSGENGIPADWSVIEQ